MGVGYDQEDSAFDKEILFYINAGIFTLSQLGIKSKEDGFTVVNKDVTYEDYLGPNCSYYAAVNQYFVCKTKLEWDTPQSSAIIEVLKAMVKELEWRLCEQADEHNIFE